MRRVLTERRNIKAGDLVVVRVALGKGQKFARIGLWSAAPGSTDYSPHSDPSPLDDDGLPVMVSVKRWSLDYRIANRKAATVEWHAADALDFRLVQDIDGADELAPYASIKSYGPYRQAIRRILAHIGRIARRDHDASQRGSRGQHPPVSV